MIKSCFAVSFDHILPVSPDAFRSFLVTVGLDHKIDVEFTPKKSFLGTYFFGFYVRDPYCCLGTAIVDCIDDFDYLKSNNNFNFKEMF